MPDTVFKSTSTKFMTGYSYTGGSFHAVTVHGINLTYGTDDDGNTILTGGTIQSIKEGFYEADFSKMAVLYRATEFSESDIATINQTNPNWYMIDNIRTTISQFDGVTLKMFASMPFYLLDGFSGDDIFKMVEVIGHTSYANLLIDGGAGDDIIKGGSEIDHLFGGTGNDRLFGFGDDDVLFGDDGDDRIDGGTGNDKIFGGDGADLIFGGTGDDEIRGENGSDRIFGGDGDDTIFGSPTHNLTGDDIGDNRISGGIGDDVVLAGNGDDRLHGGADNDTLNAGHGSDLVRGGTGNDTLVDDGYGDFALHGNDILTGGDGDDVIFSFYGDDRISGGSGNDHIESGYGNDVIHGGDGDDRITSYGGINIVTGDAGADLFIFHSDAALQHLAINSDNIDETGDLSGVTTIRDFNAPEDTLIFIRRHDTTAQEQYDLFLENATEQGNHLVWTGDTGLTTVVFKNLDLDDLSVENFTVSPEFYYDAY